MSRVLPRLGNGYYSKRQTMTNLVLNAIMEVTDLANGICELNNDNGMIIKNYFVLLRNSLVSENTRS